MQVRPTLLNSCAKAATAAEARFRIDVPIAPSRATRILALDDESVDVVQRVAYLPWASARFLVCSAKPRADDRELAEVGLEGLDGAVASLGDELEGVDVVVMVATSDAGAEAASVVGAACTVRGIMTAALVLGERGDEERAVAALRPHARFILVTSDEQDVSEVLSALRT
jgi:hypothetical protein